MQEHLSLYKQQLTSSKALKQDIELLKKMGKILFYYTAITRKWNGGISCNVRKNSHKKGEEMLSKKLFKEK